MGALITRVACVSTRPQRGAAAINKRGRGAEPIKAARPRGRPQIGERSGTERAQRRGVGPPIGAANPTAPASDPAAPASDRTARPAPAPRGAQVRFSSVSPRCSPPHKAMVMFKKVKTFTLAFSEPDKVYCSGEKVAGRVLVEVTKVTRVSAVKVLACGVARVNWAKGPQQCRQEMEYLRFEDVLALEEQPTGEDMGRDAVNQQLLLLLGVLRGRRGCGWVLG